MCSIWRHFVLVVMVFVVAVFHGKSFVCFCGEPKETKEIILPAVVAGRLSDVGGNVVDDDDDDGVATHDVDAKSILWLDESILLLAVDFNIKTP